MIDVMSLVFISSLFIAKQRLENLPLRVHRVCYKNEYLETSLGSVYWSMSFSSQTNMGKRPF